MTVRDFWSQGIRKMMRNPDSHTVRKGLTPHPIVRTSKIPQSHAADPNGSRSHGERPDANTYPAVWSLPHRNNLPSTNQHNPTTAWHFIPYHPVPYTPKQVPSQTNDDYKCWISRYPKMIRNPKSHTVRRCLTLHPIVSTTKILVSQAANPNGSLYRPIPTHLQQ